MPKPEKVQIVDEIKGKLENSQVVILTDYRGLTVNEVSELRSKLRAGKTEYKVYKNTLVNLAIHDQSHLAGLSAFLTGPTALVFNASDPVEPAKILMDFAKAHENLEIKGGILQDNIIDLEKIKFLTKLPSRETLLAKLAGTLKAPLSNLVFGLSALPKQLVFALEAVRQQKEENNN